jgi:hypothetical protein
MAAHPSFPPQPANTAQVGGPDSLEWGTRLVALRVVLVSSAAFRFSDDGVMHDSRMSVKTRLGVVLELALVAVFAVCVWAPWDRATDAATSSINMLWLSLPMMLARRGAHLETVTATVTICTLATAAIGALLAVAARMRGSAGLWAAGMFLFAGAVAILMPVWTAVGFLGAVLLLVALRARFAPVGRMRALAAVLTELWPVGYAVGFAVLAWRYNPRLLIQVLVVSLGLSLVARALVPTAVVGEKLRTKFSE